MFLILPELWYQCIIIAMAFGIGILAYMVLVPARPRGAVTCLTPTACSMPTYIVVARDTFEVYGPAYTLEEGRDIALANCAAGYDIWELDPPVLPLSVIRYAPMFSALPVVIPPINRPEVDDEWLPRHPPTFRICPKCGDGGGCNC